MKVVVLMSSYNGERFIEEQLASIYNQDFDSNIEILIRDDGSCDGTVSAIKHFRQTKERPDRSIKLIVGKNVGVQRSFLRLIKLAPEADYYFFADQDDVWREDKVKEQTGLIENNSEQCKGIPVMAVGNYSHTDEKLGIFEESVIKEEPDFTPLKMLFYNKIPGCCMAMNRILIDDLKKMNMNNVMMHDSFALSYCCYSGKVLYDDRSFILHRIHGSNVVGKGHRKIVPIKWVIEKTRLLLKGEKYDLSVMADRFLKVSEGKYFSRSTVEYGKDIILLRDYKKSLKNTILLLGHKDSTEDLKDRTTMSVKAHIIFRLY